MNIKKLFVIALLSLTFSAGTHAHSNHGPKGPIAQEQVETKTRKFVHSLIQQGGLDESWSNAKRVETAQRDTSQGKVWVIEYLNDAEQDASKRSLYMVLDELGNTLSVTHSAP
ncbi:DUF6488 family protein [Neptuniibacter halophilus]|uniref:DUF6488 family protein n=1 Tax=Neptuniibacter halophilus TaxID=651666 RepID=UPI0025727B5F|nr:DUF6488 family protein [Neptuniibacter halophilus]